MGRLEALDEKTMVSHFHYAKRVKQLIGEKEVGGETHSRNEEILAIAKMEGTQVHWCIASAKKLKVEIYPDHPQHPHLLP